MAVKKRGLGRGLDALFGEEVLKTEQENIKKEKAEKAGKEVPGEIKDPELNEVLLKITQVVPNPGQPRKTFDKDALEELTQSIKEYGIVAPLIVKKAAKKGAAGDVYEIIAGERRWRAAQAAGLKEVPVLIRDYDDQVAAEIAIVENLQREDLNPIEEARAYAGLMEVYELSQEEVAKKVSKSRSTVTNMLRLLKLDMRVQEMLSKGEITGGHARALLTLENGDAQKSLADLIVEQKLSVREVEKKVRALSKKEEKPEKKDKEKEEDGKDFDDSIFYKEYEDKLKALLGTKVKINRKDKSKGRIEIEYYSEPELERILELIQSLQ